MGYEFGSASKKAQTKSTSGYRFGQASAKAQGKSEISGPKEKPDGFLKTLIKAPIESLLVKPAARATEALGRLGVFGEEAKKGYEIQADEGGQKLNLGPLGKYNVEAVRGGTSGIKQVAGEAAEAGSYFVGGGAAKTAGTQAIKSTLGTAVKTGVRQGAIGGGLGGLGVGLQQEGAGIGDVAKSTAFGAGIGAGIGGAIPLAVRGAQKGVQGIQKFRTARSKATEEAVDMLARNKPDSRVVKYTMDGSKKLKDREAIEAIKQGLEDTDVAILKGSSPKDIQAYREMVNIAKKSKTDKSYALRNRPSDVAGKSFLKSAKFLVDKNKEAGKNLNLVASKLKSKSVNIQSPIEDFFTQLDDAGVTLKPKGDLNFVGSNFEGVGGAEKALREVANRLKKLGQNPNAQDAHRLKAYIDNLVTYGRRAEGLSGQAENIIKGLRRNVDTILDEAIPAYNQANIVYADTIRQINNLQSIAGKRFRIVDDVYNPKKLSNLLRRVHSQAGSQSDVLRVFDEIQSTATKYGMVVDEDIISQSYFANKILEDIYGSPAPTSLTGISQRVAKGAQETAGAVDALRRGNVFGAGAKAITKTIDIARGINQQNKIKALDALLDAIEKRGGGKTGVFGKPKTPIAPIVKKGKGGIPKTNTATKGLKVYRG